MQIVNGKADITGKKVGIVVAKWNELVTKALLEGALDTLQSCGNPEVVVVHVPGTWEIPVVAKNLLNTCDGLVALGCIIQGATTHAALLASDVSSALARLQMESGKPITWGVLTPENQEQALDRAGLKLGNKGREAASALVETLSVLDQLS
ncbi:6,7-dimethyl-8-ribityllumazine synthase [Geitlerinema splendidum]|nr:6,7-dimethyl-8-ribityllumazine synthase [Geitlerinema splendidum]